MGRVALMGGRAKSLGKMDGAQRVEPGPTHIKDLIPDPQNRRAHNPRNIGMLVDALQKVGASRSIVVDENGVILAGNGVIEAASEAGLTKVQIVDADGETIVAVRRRGLSDEQKRDLAIYDNRTAELATWDAEQLASDQELGLNLQPFWSPDEWARLMPNADIVADLTAEWVNRRMPEFQNPPKVFKHLNVYFRTLEDFQDFQALLAHVIAADTKTLWYAKR